MTTRRPLASVARVTSVSPVATGGAAPGAGRGAEQSGHSKQSRGTFERGYDHEPFFLRDESSYAVSCSPVGFDALKGTKSAGRKGGASSSLREAALHERRFDHVRFLIGEDGIGEIALAGIATDGDDQLPGHLRPRGDLQSGEDIGSAEMPTSIPSSRAARRAIAIASSLVTRMTSW